MAQDQKLFLWIFACFKWLTVFSPANTSFAFPFPFSCLTLDMHLGLIMIVFLKVSKSAVQCRIPKDRGE